MVEVLVIDDGDEGVEIFARDLTLEGDDVIQDVIEGGELGVTIYDNDFGVAINVCELVFVQARLVGGGGRVGVVGKGGIKEREFF